MEDKLELLNYYIESGKSQEIEKCLKECIEEIKQSGNINNPINDYGETLLHYVVSNSSSLSKDGTLEIVKLLLESDANPNIKDEEGYTAVHVAFEDNKLKILKLLIDNDKNPADLTIENQDGKTPTDVGVSYDVTLFVGIQEVKRKYQGGLKPEVFDFFFDTVNEDSILSRYTNLKESKAGTDSKKLEPLDLLGLSYLLDIIKKNEENQGYEKLEALLANLKESKSYDDSKELEAFRQSIERMKFLYKTYYDPQKTLDELYKIDDQKEFRECFIEVCEKLCEFGKGVAKFNLDNIAELKLALSIANDLKIEEISTLLQELLNSYKLSIPELLKDAIYKGNLDTVKKLLANGADPNIPDSDGKKVLHFAAENRRLDIVKQLLEHGADPTALSIRNGYTLFHIPVKNREPEILKRLFIMVREYLTKEDKNNQNEPSFLDAESRTKIVDATIRKLLNTKGKDGKTAVHLVIENVEHDQKVTIAEILLANGADLNIPDKDGNKALHLAILNTICHPFPFNSVHDHLNIINTLLAHDKNPNAKNKNGDAPLHLVIQAVDNYNHPQYLLIIEALLNHDAVDPNPQNDKGETPLQLFLFKKKLKEEALEIVEKLLAKGATLKEGDISKLISIDSELIHKAAKYGHSKIIEVLLANGVKADTLNEYGETALQVAVENKQRKCIEVLLTNNVANRADPNLKNNDGRTPLHLAVLYEYSQELLLDNGADPRIKDANGDTALHLAAKKYRYLTVVEAELKMLEAVVNKVKELLVEESKDITTPDQSVEYITEGVKSFLHTKGEKGNTVLHFAVDSQHLDIVKKLFANGADPRVQNADGNTALHLVAKEFRDFTVVEVEAELKMLEAVVNKVKELLVEESKDITNPDQSVEYITEGVKSFLNTKGERGNTALHFAVERGHLDIVELLLALGADPNRQNDKGNTPLHLLLCLKENSEGQHLERVKLLLARGADPDIKNKNGSTALHFAVQRGHLDIVELLLARGADPSVKDNNGNTAHDFATKKDLRMVNALNKQTLITNVEVSDVSNKIPTPS